MLKYYAFLDENNICYAVYRGITEPDESNVISIDDFNEALVGKRYYNKNWIDITNYELFITNITSSDSNLVINDEESEVTVKQGNSLTLDIEVKIFNENDELITDTSYSNSFELQLVDESNTVVQTISLEVSNGTGSVTLTLDNPGIYILKGNDLTAETQPEQYVSLYPLTIEVTE